MVRNGKVQKTESNKTKDLDNFYNKKENSSTKPNKLSKRSKR